MCYASRMKSAYELAMEKLEKEQGTLKPLSEAQKAKLAELTQEFQAKTAERELALKPQIEAARERGDIPAATELENALEADLAKLAEQLEAKKEAVRADTQG